MKVTVNEIHYLHRGNRDLQKSLVEYKKCGFITSKYAMFCKFLENLPRRKPSELRRMTRPEDSSTSIVREEHNLVKILPELVFHISLPKDISVDLFKGTFSLAVVCLTLEEEDGKPLRNFVGFEIEKEGL